jgi:hypothetical protein
MADWELQPDQIKISMKAARTATEDRVLAAVFGPDPTVPFNEAVRSLELVRDIVQMADDFCGGRTTSIAVDDAGMGSLDLLLALHNPAHLASAVGAAFKAAVDALKGDVATASANLLTFLGVAAVLARRLRPHSSPPAALPFQTPEIMAAAEARETEIRWRSVASSAANSARFARMMAVPAVFAPIEIVFPVGTIYVDTTLLLALMPASPPKAQTFVQRRRAFVRVQDCRTYDAPKRRLHVTGSINEDDLLHEMDCVDVEFGELLRRERSDFRGAVLDCQLIEHFSQKIEPDHLIEVVRAYALAGETLWRPTPRRAHQPS